MKFFTIEWCFSQLNDQEIEKRLSTYKRYINNIYKELPFPLKILVKSINLHDGILSKVTFVQNKKNLVLEGTFGDLQIGYFSLEIRYFGVSNVSKENLYSIFKDQKVEILSDEIELFSKDRFSHKILFSTKEDIEIVFNDLQLLIGHSNPENYKNINCQIQVL